MVRWFLLFVIACSHTPAADSPPAQRAFYFWRTTMQLSPAEQQALAELHIDRLYVRMFDVEWNQAPELVGKITGHAPAVARSGSDRAASPKGGAESIEIVPVIFLRDEVFHRIEKAQVGELARTVWAEVGRRATLLGFTPHELQVDCDWTESSRESYFAFLRELHATAKLELSATIRLHQVKYRERTGVPPVSRGMLMFYNMGKFSADPEARAIFDAASARKYLARIHEYPLPLDGALPIWSWVVHLRDDRVEDLLQSTDPDELAQQPFLERAAGKPGSAGRAATRSVAEVDDRFVATRNAFLHGTLLREGDVLKVEVIGPADAMAAATLLAPELATVAHPRTISLFDLSERNLTRHGTASLDQVFRSIR